MPLINDMHTKKTRLFSNGGTYTKSSFNTHKIVIADTDTTLKKEKNRHNLNKNNKMNPALNKSLNDLDIKTNADLSSLDISPEMTEKLLLKFLLQQISSQNSKNDSLKNTENNEKKQSSFNTKLKSEKNLRNSSNNLNNLRNNLYQKSSSNFNYYEYEDHEDESGEDNCRSQDANKYDRIDNKNDNLHKKTPLNQFNKKSIFSNSNTNVLIQKRK